MGLIAWIVVGLIAGFLAKVLMPGGRAEPGSWGGTLLLGIVGAVLGGWLSSMFLGGGGPSGINIGSILIAVLGACVLIGVLRLIQR
jgi:uncharacterized membrane protein YeaQ/YmgE (transglycosylase-associated protein family)